MGGVDLDVVDHALVDEFRLLLGHPARAVAPDDLPPAATSASHRTPTHSTSSPSSDFRHRCCECAPPRNTSSTITRAPAQAVAATPARQAASSRVNSSPTLTPPSAANSMPVPEDWSEAGIDSTNPSIPKASHGSGRTACRQRTIPDLPELEPPLSTIA